MCFYFFLENISQHKHNGLNYNHDVNNIVSNEILFIVLKFVRIINLITAPTFISVRQITHKTTHNKPLHSDAVVDEQGFLHRAAKRQLAL
jgi:hypothetical protein